jgi:mRNA-degrading endonuclease RelE of RelBE toxin-antitoxin system
MIYELAFKKSALKEWKKLGPNIRELFTKNSRSGFPIHMFPPQL